MLDDFGLFHIFCLDVFFQLVIFATGQVETFHSESVDGLTIVVDTTILLYIHAWQLFQYIFQWVISFVGKASEVERYGVSTCDARAFYLYFLQDKSCWSHTDDGFFSRWNRCFCLFIPHKRGLQFVVGLLFGDRKHEGSVLLCSCKLQGLSIAEQCDGDVG